MDKFTDDIGSVVAQIPDGATLAIGGFGYAGLPLTLCDALCEADRRDLTIVSNNIGGEDRGGGRLAREGRVRKFVGSFPIAPVFTEQLMTGRAEIELLPQGTMVERLRAAGAGIGAFYTATSVKTSLADGTYPSRYDADGHPVAFMAPKETREIDGRLMVLEYALHVDFAFVKAHRADRLGNLQFRLAARNFNPAVAMAAKVAIVETEEFVEVGDIEPDDVHLPGLFVDHVVLSEGAAR
ncbi:3-oxoacid CoA-transferase subunit A [Microbacterium ulmi]|uniref:3-oxoacid CoA-transferase subunit A n=1 Tax=Microbacterium ulmi TaxID=179095 RepID=A0A7Y2M1A8_9MICO|nr:3-oxoacid CoA-transferase subunit A [Microbacterium ulmi]